MCMNTKLHYGKLFCINRATRGPNKNGYECSDDIMLREFTFVFQSVFWVLYNLGTYVSIIHNAKPTM